MYAVIQPMFAPTSIARHARRRHSPNSDAITSRTNPSIASASPVRRVSLQQYDGCSCWYRSHEPGAVSMTRRIAPKGQCRGKGYDRAQSASEAVLQGAGTSVGGWQADMVACDATLRTRPGLGGGEPEWPQDLVVEEPCF